jgi:hypothetical protein
MPVNEIELPNPLTDEEIKLAIARKMTDAFLESLDKTCALFGKSYPKFKATWTIHFELDNFGDVRVGNIKGELPVQEHSEVTGEFVQSGTPMETAVAVDLEGEIPETPPNQLRKETDQAVPVQVINERGVQSEKAVLYQPKRRRGNPNWIKGQMPR